MVDCQDSSVPILRDQESYHSPVPRPPPIIKQQQPKCPTGTSANKQGMCDPISSRWKAKMCGGCQLDPSQD